MMPPGEKDLITVVITNYERCDDLRIALKSVGAQNYRQKDIVVVDNASGDGSLSMLREEFPEVRLIALDENIGMDGYSVGFHEAKGQYIFQMDNDSLMPDENVLSEVVKRFQMAPPDLAVVATRVEEYNPLKDRIERLRKQDPRLGPINTGGFHSGGVGFRKEFLDQVGYYNRDVFLYVSEIFLQMKFLAAGYKIFFYPELLMLHKSSGVARSKAGIYYELRNRYWFFRRFATPAQQLLFFPMILLNDIVYAVFKQAPKQFLSALKDGFSQMPSSLKPNIRSDNADFIHKVNEIGWKFNPANTFRHVYRKILLKKKVVS